MGGKEWKRKEIGRKIIDWMGGKKMSRKEIIYVITVLPLSIIFFLIDVFNL